MFGLFKSKSAKAGDNTLASALRNSGAPIDFWQQDWKVASSNGNPIIEQCTNVIATSIASLNITHMRDGQRVPNSHIEKLLKKPNNFQSGRNFMEILVRETLENGSGRIYKEVGTNFKPKALFNVRCNPKGFTEDGGSLMWDAVSMPLQNKTLKDSVPNRLIGNLIFKANPASPLNGIPMADGVEEAAALFNVAMNNALDFFEGANNFDTFISTDMVLGAPETKALRERLNELGKGAGTPILTSGLRAERLGQNYENAQLSELLRLTRETISANYRIPTVMLNDNTNSSQQNDKRDSVKIFFTHNLNYYTDTIVEVLETLFDVPTHESLSFDMTQFDEQTGMQEKAQSLAMNQGFMSINEQRVAWGLDVLDDAKYDEVGVVNEPSDEPSDEEKIDAMIAGVSPLGEEVIEEEENKA